MNEVPIAGEADDRQARQSDLGRRARSGAAWIVFGFGAGQVLRLAANIALAALLQEEVFALMAIVAALMQGLAMFSDIGLRSSMVQNPRGDEDAFIDTAWTLQVIRGGILCIMAMALAWPLASLYGANDSAALQLRWLIPIVAITAVIDGFQSSRFLTAARQMQIGRMTRLEMVVQLTNAVVMLSLAWLMRSVFALAIAAVVASALRMALSYWMLPGRRSRFHLEKAALNSILSFGQWIFLSTMLAFLSMQIDRLVFAGLFPLADVGVYSIAASLAMLVGVLAGSLQTSVIFPWYSRMLDEGVPLDEAFRRTRAPILLMSTFACSQLVAGAGSFFELAYSHRYVDGATYLPILAVGAWFSTVESMYGSAFLATGRSRWVAFVGATKVVSFLAFLVPVMLFDAPMWAGALIAMASEVARTLAAQILGRKMGLRNVRIETGMLALLVVTGALGLGLVNFVPWVAGLHPAWRLVLVGLVSSLIFMPLFLRHFWPLIRRRMG
ncbi:MAG: oligosaccharide flippase family protein [Burkholderiaceae bacterium]